MAYNGYFLKINGYIFPNSFISLESLIITPDQTMDDDSYRDANGELHRSLLPHKITKIEFNTPMLTQENNTVLQSFFTKPTEMQVEYYNPKQNNYKTGKFYSTDPDFTVNFVIGNTIYYNPVRIALIEY